MYWNYGEVFSKCVTYSHGVENDDGGGYVMLCYVKPISIENPRFEPYRLRPTADKPLVEHNRRNSVRILE